MNNSFTTVSPNDLCTESSSDSNVKVGDLTSNYAATIRPTSRQFAEQIKQLEIEGGKLREVTMASLTGVQSMDVPVMSTEANKTVPASTSVPSLSSLIEISSEQKTISDLRVQLEQQRKETDRLQTQLLTDVTPSHSFTSVPSSPSKSAFSTLMTAAATADPFSSSSRNRAFEFVPPSHLERALKESQEQVAELKKKLQESRDLAEGVKRQFRSNIEDLKTKLHETVVNRDTILDLRQKEAASQERVISRLKMSVQQQYDRNKDLESSLEAATHKLDTLSQSSLITDAVISQMKTLVQEKEKTRGKPFFDNTFTSSQGTAMLVPAIERYIEDIQRELESKRSRVIELEQDLQRCQSTSTLKEQSLSQEFHTKLQKETEEVLTRMTQLTLEHERNLESANERAANSRKQTATLQSQLEMLQNQHEEQMKFRNNTIKELEGTVHQLTSERTQDRTKWQDRREVLEKNLDKIQRELTEVRMEREEATRKCSSMETHIQDFQGCVKRLEHELETERERIMKQLNREEELRGKLLQTENNLAVKDHDVEHLEKMLDAVKQQCSSQLQDRVQNVEKVERERSGEQIKNLTAQLTSQTEKCNKVTIELEVSKAEMAKLREQVTELTEKLESVRCQFEAAMLENRHLAEMVSISKQDVEKLSSEKESCLKQLNDKKEELAKVRNDQEKLVVQLTEKEKNILTLQHQSDNISQLVEVNSRTSDNIHKEKERILYMLSEKSTAVDEMKSTQENLFKKLELREQRIQDLEEERMKLTEELALKVQETDVIHQDKDNLFKELKDSRIEVANIAHAKEAIKKELAKQRAVYEKALSSLKTKYKGVEHDLKLAQKTMKSKDQVDNKAVRYADKMQKEVTNKRGEVDSLLSKVRHLEDKLESLAQENLATVRDNKNLKKSLGESLVHVQQLTTELEHGAIKHQEFREHITHLEEKVEKAALKAAASQAQLQQYEQNMAKLKLTHQLDLKEANKVVNSIPGHYAVHSISPSQTISRASARHNVAQRSTSTSPLQHWATTASVQTETVDVARGDVEPDKKSAEVGQDLKSLLTEMKSLIAGQKAEGRSHRSTVHHSSPFHPANIRSESSPEAESLSDSDIEPTYLRSNARSHIDFSGVSSVRSEEPASPSRNRNRRQIRSYSADRDMPNEASTRSNKPQRDNQYTDGSHFSMSGSAYTESPSRGKVSLSSLTPDTQELCKRLEEKIDNLTKMGGNLQRENKEMATIMNRHGRKLDCVRENERKLRKSPR